MRKIISGAQTGVDRAAIDAAKENTYYSWGGWVPKGRICEDGQIPDEYFQSERLDSGLIETDSSRYPKRTRMNIKDADATLILVPKKKLSPGTKLTLSLCRKLKKHYMIFDPYKSYKVPNCTKWICESPIEVLNVAGPRESKMPGIYERSKVFLTEAFHYSELYRREGIKIWEISKRVKS